MHTFIGQSRRIKSIHTHWGPFGRQSRALYNIFTHADNAPFRFIDVIEVFPFSAAASCIAPSAPMPFSARATAGVTRGKRANLRKNIM